MAHPWPTQPPADHHRAAYADATRRSFWLDRQDAGTPCPPLNGDGDADLCIVGAGFTGLWAALAAKADDPDRDVVVLEAQTAGFGASGRNGGFIVASLTHGIANGMARFGEEMPALERLALENFDGIVADLDRHGIDCDFEPTGELLALLAPYQHAWATQDAELLRRFGHEVELLDGEAMRAQIDSPLYHGGLWDRTGAGVLDPQKLALGLREAALRAGVRIHEHTPVATLERERAAVGVLTPRGRLRARRVVLATSGYPPLLRAIRRYVAPVYDHVLITAPLSASQLASIGWAQRQGVGDAANLFHYYRLTRENRILWGGYDAVYRMGGPVGPQYDDHEPTFATLAQHFFATFPQLEGLRFTHRWGGVIDTCSRFSVFFGTAHDGRVAYATGYTGLGVAATRFGARVALDLVDGRDTELTRLRYVRRRPIPFPPEPLRYAAIQATRNRLVAADRNGGRRGLWLRTLDAFGLGFDS